MKTGIQVLFVLLTIRLMVPPGVCMCKASSPILHAVAQITGLPAPPAEDEHDDNHHPGCPCSGLGVGMGLKPASPSIDAPARLSLPGQFHAAE